MISKIPTAKDINGMKRYYVFEVALDKHKTDGSPHFNFSVVGWLGDSFDTNKEAEECACDYMSKGVLAMVGDKMDMKKGGGRC